MVRSWRCTPTKCKSTTIHHIHWLLHFHMCEESGNWCALTHHPHPRGHIRKQGLSTGVTLQNWNTPILTWRIQPLQHVQYIKRMQRFLLSFSNLQQHGSAGENAKMWALFEACHYTLMLKLSLNGIFNLHSALNNTVHLSVLQPWWTKQGTNIIKAVPKSVGCITDTVICRALPTKQWRISRQLRRQAL